MRTAFVQELTALARENPNLWLVAGDLGYMVLDRFTQAYPRRFVNAGVAEQNMTGLAAGLALCGKRVFTYSIANFPTLRCLEQIRNDLCGHRAKVTVVSVGAGFAYGAQGYTHHGLEMAAILRTLPSLAVCVPGDAVEARLATRALATLDGPSFLSLGKAGEPAVHAGFPAFAVGRVIPVIEGGDVLLVACGGVLSEARQAVELLKGGGIRAALWSSPWLAPFDDDALRAAAARHRLIVTVEEGTLRGGLGGAVAESVAAVGAGCRVLRLGWGSDILHEAVSQEAARRRLGIDARGIADAVRSALSSPTA